MNKWLAYISSWVDFRKQDLQAASGSVFLEKELFNTKDTLLEEDEYDPMMLMFLCSVLPYTYNKEASHVVSGNVGILQEVLQQLGRRRNTFNKLYEQEGAILLDRQL